ncbi:unnamed protein product [Brachionus calyciflorus]|uniref:OTU domain-containing protein n=1 Tax=Brachionus calyciflorus TaxID=104777 RepID=A0A814P6F2_9BILA|nr:unnamed protein product [Brachionus calyciflorus]
MDDENHYYQFKMVTDRQKLHINRTNTFNNLIKQLKQNNFDELKNSINSQLKTASAFSIIRKRQIIFNPKNDLVDKISRSLLIKSKFELFDLAPVSIVGDGNCFFRSLSKALYGEEKYDVEIRYRTLVEMILRKDEFLEYAKQQKIDWFYNLSPSIDKLNEEEVFIEQIFNCSKLDSWSTLWHIFSAQAFSIDICLVYPTIKKYQINSMIEYLNGTIRCLDRSIQGPVRIFWSNSNDEKLECPAWKANHFICLLPYRKINYDEIIIKNKIEMENEKRLLSDSSQVTKSQSRPSIKKIKPYINFNNNYDQTNSNFNTLEFENDVFDMDKIKFEAEDSFQKSSLSWNENRDMSLIEQDEKLEHSESTESASTDEELSPLSNSLSPIHPNKSLSIESVSDHLDCQDETEKKNSNFKNVDLQTFHFFDAIRIAFTENSVQSLPKSVDKNSLFCIDLNVFKEGDVLADDNGAYKEYGNKTKIYKIASNNGSLLVEKIDSKIIDNDFLNVFKCTKVFYKSISIDNFIRKSIKISKFNDTKSFNIMILAYVWKKKICLNNLELKVHGNSTINSHPYVRMSKTALDKVKEESIKIGSASLNYNTMIECASKDEFSLGEYPRSISQLYKYKSLQKKYKNNASSKDEYADLLINRQKSDFVRSVNFDRYGFTAIMFDQQQFVDLIRFGGSEKNFSIINIDTTFKLGRYYVTYLTFRNLSLNYNGTDCYPTFMGPVMVHVKRDFDTYLRFALELKHYSACVKLDIEKIKCIITDDDEALHGAFKTVFTRTNFMLCCNHMRKDIYKILNDYNLKDEEKEEIIQLIFGINGDRSKSLITSEDSEIYADRANKLLESTVI